MNAALVDSDAMFLEASVGVIVAAIFLTTAAHISTKYAHWVSQINVFAARKRSIVLQVTFVYQIIHNAINNPACLLTMGLIFCMSHKLSWGGCPSWHKSHDV